LPTTQTKNDKSEMTINRRLWQQCKKQGLEMPTASKALHSECSSQPAAASIKGAVEGQ